MESRGHLDFARRPTSAVFLVVIVLLLTSGSARSQTAPARDAEIKALLDQQRWADVVREVERTSNRDPNLYYYYGSALAQLSRWEEARNAFVAGSHLAPDDKRFPIELGGVAFKQKRYGEAARWLRRGLRLDRSDDYANDFLGTIYFVQGNTEAALKYWNRLGKPKVENVNVESGLRVNAALLDRAFAFSPASILRLPDLLTSEARVRGLEIFPSLRFDLAARDDGTFDVNFRGSELNGFGANNWVALLSAFRGIPYETVYAEYFNADRQAINARALVRWDDQKRRLAATFDSPLRHNPKYHWQAGADLRNEIWDVRSSFHAPVLEHLSMEKQAVGGAVTLYPSGSWNWSAGAEISHRQFRDVSGAALDPAFVPRAFQLKEMIGATRDLWRAPERRILFRGGTSVEFGRLWDREGNLFDKLQGSGDLRWYPQMNGDDYLLHGQIRAGKTFGQVPFDELFMLGLERDNDLWLRAHVGTRAGRKGSAPLGRNYFLSNWNVDKNVYSNGLFGVKLSPFIDTGKISDPSGRLGSRQWLWDVGMQVKFSILGVGVTFTYGRDLRAGNNAFYATTER